MTMMDVLITGVGAILPAGDFTLHSRPQPRFSESALADFDLRTYLESPKTYLDRCSALALAGCALALKDAGLAGPFDEDFGLSLGTLYGCVETMRGFEAKLAESGPRAVSPLLFSHSYFNSPASICAIEWGLKGYHATFCGPDAGWQAVEVARDAILLGHATRMLCGGVDALSPDPDLGVGSPGPAGASVFVVLESEASADERSASGWKWARFTDGPAAESWFGHVYQTLLRKPT